MYLGTKRPRPILKLSMGKKPGSLDWSRVQNESAKWATFGSVDIQYFAGQLGPITAFEYILAFVVRTKLLCVVIVLYRY